MLKKRLTLAFFFWLLAGRAFANPPTAGITLLHFSDLHGHLSAHPTEKGQVGGLAKFVFAVNQIRKENEKLGKATFVLFAGDLFTGTPLSSRWQGELEMRGMQRLKTDVACAGNHDFDYKLDRLRTLQKRYVYPLTAANIVYQQNQKSVFDPMVVLQTRDNIRLAILGLTTQQTPAKTHPDNVKGLNFIDPVLAVKNQWKDFTAGSDAASDLQILLTHQEDGVDKKLLKKFKGIDLVLGGHTHPAPDKPYCEAVRKRYVCKTPAYGNYLGRIDLGWENGHWHVQHYERIFLDETMPQDVSTQHWLAQYEQEIERAYRGVIGYAKEDLVHSRFQSTPLGLLVADAMRKYAQSDIALINVRGIRYSFKKGPIRMKDILTALPFPNTLQVIELTGKDLRKTIERSFRNRNSGGFLQISGLEVVVKNNRPKLYFHGKKLDSKDKFAVATSDFLIAGGDGYTIFKDKKMLRAYPIIFSDIFAEYLRKQGAIGIPAHFVSY